MSVLLSALDESYVDHIKSCLEKFEVIYPYYAKVCERIFERDEEVVREALRDMVKYHDLGKLLKKWQEAIREEKKKRESNKKNDDDAKRRRYSQKRPPHAGVGAGFLWKILPEGLREPVSFAVAIHHSNSGLSGDDIEKPDVLLIKSKVVKPECGYLIWSEEVENLDRFYFPDEVRQLTVYDLRLMAENLMIWAKGCDLGERHRRRLQASLAHHILKLCDVSSAVERRELREGELSSGIIMVKEIADYVASKVKE